MTPTNPYDELLGDEAEVLGATNPYDAFAEDEETRLRAAALGAFGKNPDAYALATEIARRNGWPVDVVANDPEAFERKDVADRAAAIGKENPAVAEWLQKPEHAALAADDYDNLDYLGKVMHNVLRASDAPRAAFAGAVRYPGQVLSGSGALLDTKSRTAAASMRSLGMGAYADFMEGQRDALPWWLDTRKVLLAAGGAIEGFADSVDVPEERKSFSTEVFSGFGQIAAMGLQGWTMPHTMLPSLFALGADTQADRAKRAGKYGTREADRAIFAGAGVTAVAERIGFWGVFERLPPNIKNKTLQWFADKATAFGVEFGQEASENIAQDLVAKAEVDPTVKVGASAIGDGTTAGTAAALMRTLLGIGGRLPDQKEGAPTPELTPEQIERGNRMLTPVLESVADAERLNTLAEAVEKLKTKGRDAAAVEELVQGIADRDDGIPSNVYIDAEALVEYFQAQGEDAAVRIADMTGDPEALDNALRGLGDVVVPVGRFATQGLADEGLRNLARLAPDRASNRELEGLSLEDLAERFLDPAEDQARADRADPAFPAEQELPALAGAIEQQLLMAGREPSVARDQAQAQARYYANRATLRRDGVTATQLAAMDNVTIRGEEPSRVPVDAQLDPLLDAVLSGEGAPAQAQTGLLASIIAAGGIRPDSVGAGDIRAMGLQRPGLFNATGLTVEAMAEQLAEQDSPWTDLFTTKDEFGRPDYREFIDILGREVTGEGVLPAETTRFADELATVKGVLRTLAARGVDVVGLSRPLLRRMVSEELGYEQTPGSGNGVDFAHGQEALESRLAQWAASLHIGAGSPRPVGARPESIGTVNRNASGAAEQGDESREALREQSARLIERAKAEGHFWDADSPILAKLAGMFANGGAEHQAYKVGEPGSEFIIRATDNGYFGPRADISPAQYLARLDDYNATFPNLQMRLVGVSESTEIEGHAVIWTVQPFVYGNEFGSQSALAAAMAEHGWKEDGPAGTPRFIHEATGTIIEDAHTGNVFYDDAGNLYPFDVVVEALPRAQDQTQLPDDPANPNMLFQSEQPFYSALLRSVEQAKGAPKKADAKAWKQWLDGAQSRGEFTQEELKWLALKEWLDEIASSTDPQVQQVYPNGMILREQIREFVRANELVLEEEIVGKDPTPFTPEMLDDLPWKAEYHVDGTYKLIDPNGAPMGAGLYDSKDEAEREAYNLSANYVRARGGVLPQVAEGFMVARLDQADIDDFGIEEDMLGSWALFEDKDGEKGEIVAPAAPATSSYAQAVYAAVQDAVEGSGLEGEFTLPGQEAPFANMTLPGGTGYKLFKLRMPVKPAKAFDATGWQARREHGGLGNGQVNWRITSPDGRSWTHVGSDDATPEAIIAEASQRTANAAARGDQFTGGHFDTNTIFHIRVDERVDADGKRVLLILEKQSDWHQAAQRLRSAEVRRLAEEAARKEGLGHTVVRFAARVDELVKSPEIQAMVPKEFGYRTGKLPDGYTAFQNEAGRWNVRPSIDRAPLPADDGILAIWKDTEAEAIASAVQSLQGSAVPDAPFKTTWPELILKRMIRYAAENGFDRVAWPTSEQVPQIEQWGMTLQEIRADPDKSKQFGAILARYETDIPRIAKKLAKKYGGEVVSTTLDLGGSAEGIMPPPNFTPMTEIDRDAFAGAENFRDGSPPLIGVGSLRIDGTERYDVAMVLDANGISFSAQQLDGEEVRVTWDDLGIRRNRLNVESSGRAIRFFTEAWNEPIDSDSMGGEASLWDALPGNIRAPQQREAVNQAIEITPKLREAALAGLPLFQKANASIAFQRDPMGRITEALVRLGPMANLSSLHHEFGHLFLENLVTDAFLPGSDPQLMDSLQRFFAWRGKELPDNERAVHDAITREDHEAFAGGYETYLWEGKAPTPGLASLFATFRSWMLAVYGAMRGRKVPIPDAMRRVYDRLYASDAEIQAAQTGGSVPDALKGLVGDVRWGAYVKKRQQALDTAQANLQASVLRPVFREATEEWKRELAAMEATVLAAAMEDRAHRARAILSKGKLPDGSDAPTQITLDGAALKAEFGDRFVIDRLKGLYRNKDGQPPGIVADLLGFGSGFELVEALTNTPPIQEWVKEEALRRLRASRTDPATDGSLPARAQDALHGSRRLTALEDELAMVAELSGAQVPPARVLGALARQQIAAMPLRSIRPNDYLTAERKAANEAFRALSLAEPKLAVALMAKRRQVMNAHLYRAALDALEAQEKGQRFLARFNKPKTRKRLGKVRGGYLEQIDAIMEQLDLRPASGPEVARRKSLADFIQVARGRGEALSIPPKLLAVIDQVNIRDLTPEQLQGIVATVRQIDHLARIKGALLWLQDKRRLREVDIANADRVSETHSSTPPTSGGVSAAAKVNSALESGLGAWLNASNLARDLDGEAEGGPVWASVVAPIQKAWAATETALAQMRERVTAVYRKHYTLAELKGLRVEHLRFSDGSLWSRQRVLALAANWGNPGNREAVLNQKNVKMTPQLVEEILATMDARDWAFVQDLAAEFEVIWPLVAEREKEKTGLVPERVEFSPFTVKTSDGQTLTLPGWYYPLARETHDSIADQEVLGQELDDQFQKLMVGENARAQTRNGSAIERVNFGGHAVRLDLDVAQSKLRESIRDVTLGPAVNDVHRILKGRRLGTAARLAGLAGHVTALNLWLVDVAAGEMGPRSTTEAVVRKVRTNASVALMGFKVSTAAIQPTGFFQSIPVIGARWLWAGMKRLAQLDLGWGTDGLDAINYVNAAHPGMALRAGTYVEQVYDVERALAGEGLNLLKHAWWMMSQTQRLVDVVTFLGAEAKGLDLFDNDLEKARAYAYDAVERAQGSMEFAGKNALQRGTLSSNIRQSEGVKSTTFMQAYMMAKGQILYLRTRNTDYKDPAQVLRLTAHILHLFVWEAMALTLLRGGWPDDEDEDDLWLDDFGAWIGKETALGMAGTHPALAFLTSQLRGFTPRTTEQAASKAFGDVIRVANDPDADLRRRAKATSTAMGAAWGYPSSQTNVAIDALWRAREGEDVPVQDYLVRPPEE